MPPQSPANQWSCKAKTKSSQIWTIEVLFTKRFATDVEKKKPWRFGPSSYEVHFTDVDKIREILEETKEKLIAAGCLVRMRLH